ncbi:NFAT activation molecule 1 [Cottoperca gobio]|uniref:NFAT activation molecule 1 n=1 Tax=Cottoperca gobio TaxID=56716 RepID=A0A6J2Q7U2_COTGO|nr:uncharacterized protein LOC115012368 [Cottoperca gobio]
MGAQQVWHLSFMSTWIFVFFFLSVCSGMKKPKLSLESTVFVAIKGEDLNIDYVLKIPANQTEDILTCVDPHNEEIYHSDIPSTTKPQTVRQTLLLKNLKLSGEYSCQYNTVEVYWFTRVRGDGYKEIVLDQKKFIIVPVITCVLLVFSVVGSVCVFRGHWIARSTESGNIKRNQKQSTEERMKREMEEPNMDVILAPSTSFYASLETRPRSIYDVLDHSAANEEPDQSKAKPKKREPQKKIPQTTEDQNEGVFECVYENF